MTDFDNPDLIFDELSHQYVLASRPDLCLTSVTRVCHEYRRRFDEQPAASSAAKRRGIKTADVLREWAEKRDNACELGHTVHAEAERVALSVGRTGGFSASLSVRGDPFFNAIYRFFSDRAELSYGWCIPEVRIASELHRMAGTIDLVCSLDGKPSIVDYKTNQRLDMFGWDNMYAPLNSLPDTNYWAYVVQLNLYARLLYEEYGYNAVGSLWIVWLLPNSWYRLTYVPDIQDKIDKMLARRTRASAKSSVAIP